MSLRKTVCSLCVSTVALAGCSTTYMPRPSQRVSVILKGGTPGYVREGRVYEGGLFGGDLDEAVRGNPEAESHAKTYQSLTIAGFVSTLAGAASLVGGATLFVTNTDGPSNARDSTAQAGGAVLMVGGLAAYVVGLVLLTNAQPHLWDAINVYNDVVPDFARPPPYGPNGPGAPPYGPNGPAGPSPYGPNGPVPVPPSAPPAR